MSLGLHLFYLGNLHFFQIIGQPHHPVDKVKQAENILPLIASIIGMADDPKLPILAMLHVMLRLTRFEMGISLALF